MNHRNTSVLAIAIASLASGAASAAIPAVSASFFVSGASAARAVTPAIAATLCQAGTIAKYEYTTKPKDHNLTVCTLKTTAQDPDVPAALSGLSVAIYGRAAGGSLFGVKPIVEPKFLQFLDPAGCPNTDGNDATVQQCPGLQGADPTVGTPSGSGQVPLIGISDEDMEFAGNVGAEVDPSVVAPLTASEKTRLDDFTAGNLTDVSSEVAFQLIWSIQANNAFPLNDISETTLRGIYVGTYTTLGEIIKAEGLTSTPSQDAQGLKVCLRTNTSGTAAGHKNLWTGSNFCNTPGATSQVNETSDDGYANGYDVVMNTSSGNVETCLNSATYAIGINSLENSGLAGIKELSIDGELPTLAGAARGNYKYYSESTLQSHQRTLDATLTGTAWATAANTSIEAASGAGATGDARRNGFVELFKLKARTPAAIAASGLNGILATITNGGTPDSSFTGANPVGWTSKLGQNCENPTNLFNP